MKNINTAAIAWEVHEVQDGYHQPAFYLYGYNGRGEVVDLRIGSHREDVNAFCAEHKITPKQGATMTEAQHNFEMYWNGNRDGELAEAHLKAVTPTRAIDMRTVFAHLIHS